MALNDGIDVRWWSPCTTLLLRIYNIACRAGGWCFVRSVRNPWSLCVCCPPLIKIGISLAGFAALAVLIWTGRLDAALPFAAIALGFALYDEAANGIVARGL